MYHFKGPPIEYVQARYTFIARKRDQLGFKPGDIIAVRENRRYKHWWTGELKGRIGLFPSSYTTPTNNPNDSEPTTFMISLSSDESTDPDDEFEMLKISRITRNQRFLQNSMEGYDV